jgi:hypothetical protein
VATVATASRILARLLHEVLVLLVVIVTVGRSSEYSCRDCRYVTRRITTVITTDCRRYSCGCLPTRGRTVVVVIGWVISWKVRNGTGCVRRRGRQRWISCNKYASAALIAATETTTVRCWGGRGIRVGGKRKIGRREIRVGVKIQDVGFICLCI